ncbi:helix-turn-helix transcriptional regulator [Streptomyces halstedii]|uniref:helix-turn-helix domain-containing protein n=1 Tax=Streptomyces halstedii TaxID=1944 RepID=UPI003460C10E
MRSRSGRTVQHAVLAARIQRLREGAGLSRVEAAEALGAHSATIRRIEKGETSLNAGQVSVLLEKFGASREEIDDFLTGLAAANVPGWWHPWRDVMDAWQLDLMSVESASSIIRTWHPTLVPELLRTPTYARALEDVFRSDLTTETRIRRVELLTQRQERLQEKRTRIWALMEESALCTRVGGDAVMHEQITALHEAALRKEITLQVHRLTDPVHALTATTGLTLYRVDVAEIPDHVVRDSAVGLPDIWDDQKTVTAYRTLMDKAAAAAPHPSAPLPTTCIDH